MESCPTTWPSCMANRVPPTFRMILLAPSIMPDISSGACSSSTAARESEMLVATGSANWVQIGIVAATHSERLNSRGVAVSSEIVRWPRRATAAATTNACSRASRSAGAVGWLERAANDLALLQGEVPVDAVLAVLQGALQLRDQLRDHLRVVRAARQRRQAATGSICELPDRNSRSMSRNSSSGSLSESSGMATTLTVCQGSTESLLT